MLKPGVSPGLEPGGAVSKNGLAKQRQRSTAQVWVQPERATQKWSLDPATRLCANRTRRPEKQSQWPRLCTCGAWRAGRV